MSPARPSPGDLAGTIRDCVRVGLAKAARIIVIVWVDGRWGFAILWGSGYLVVAVLIAFFLEVLFGIGVGTSIN